MAKFPPNVDSHKLAGSPPTVQVLGAIIWSLILVALVLLGTNKLSKGYVFDSNILTLLPDENLPHQLLKANQEIIKDRDRDLLLLVQSKPESEKLPLIEAAYHQLIDSDLFEKVDGQKNPKELNTLYESYDRWRFNLLSLNQIAQLQESDQTLLNDALAAFFSPGGLTSASILEDPLGLFQHWQTSLYKNQSVFIRDNWLTIEKNGLRYRLLHIQLKENAFDPEYQQQVGQILKTVSDSIGERSKLLSYGMIIHASHGTQQAKREIATIGLSSAIGITLLLLVIFRSIRDLLLVFLPLLLGISFSFGLCLIIFEKIHLITLAFGTSLIGIAIDYSLHYLCARKEQNASTITRILPGLTLAMISSVSAYTAQAMAPFPGLRQMAVFTALGLIAAWISVIVLLPLLSGHTNARQASLSHHIAKIIQSLATHWARLARGPARTLYWGIAIIALIGASQISLDDSLKSLQTSPDELIENDRFINELLSSNSIGNYLLVSGSSEQLVLEREEQIRRFLLDLEGKDRLTGHRATSQHIPSAQQQYKNHQLHQERIYAETGLAQQFFEKIGAPELSSEARKKFVETPFSAMSWKDWQEHPGSKLNDALWIGKIDDQFFSVIALIKPNLEDIGEDLKRAANTIDGVHYIDRPGSIVGILTEYRENLFKLLVFAYILITTILFFRYGKSTFAVIAPAFFASITTLFLMSLCSIPLTVFHCLALLLVLGIGLDAAIFLKETSASAYTWLAISTSSITTFFAFGLLSLSQTPVLQFFGQTVAVGILAIWLLAPIFCIPKDLSNA